MKQNSALSWSLVLVGTCLLGVGLGLSLGYAIFSPKMAAGPIEASAPLQQAAETPDQSAPPSRAETNSVATSLQTSTAPSGPPVKAVETAMPAPTTTPLASGASGYWAARHLFISVNGQWLADGAKDLLKEVRPGGVLLQDVNLGSRTQTFALVKEIKAAVGLGEGLGDLPLIGVAQEVGPYNLLGLENAPSAQTIGQNGDPELARKLGQDYGAACVGRGIAIAFAPVLDVFEPGAINPGFAVRSFGTEHTLVARIGLAMADGLRQGGVLPVVKNFPGYGAATYGSDGLLVALNKDPAGLGKLLYPFDQAVRRGVPGMLVAHVAVPALDPENPRRPAALSPVLVTELLRGRWGYDGVVVADDVALNPMTRTMGAEQAAVQALAAGCDAVILLDPDPARIRAVCAAIANAVEHGTLSPEKLQQSVTRLTRWQEAIGNLNPIPASADVAHVAQALPIEASPEPASPSVVSVQPPATVVADAPPAVTNSPEAAPPVATAEAKAPAVETALPPTNDPAPPAESAKEAPALGEMTLDAAGTEDSRSLIEHTVSEGETLDKIALAYAVTADDLKKWNELTADPIATGTKLKVYLAEGGGASAAPPRTAPAEPVESEPAPAPQVESPTAAAPIPAGLPGKAVYTVAAGDTIASVAEKFHVAAADLKLWNGLESDTPEVGTVLTIFLTSEPAPVEVQPVPAASTPAPDSAVPIAPDIETEIYVVQSGDTVNKIARAYKTTREIVLALNGLKDANQIKQGQKLKVPKLPS